MGDGGADVALMASASPWPEVHAQAGRLVHAQHGQMILILTEQRQAPMSGSPGLIGPSQPMQTASYAPTQEMPAALQVGRLVAPAPCQAGGLPVMPAIAPASTISAFQAGGLAFLEKRRNFGR
jgi:hypothetical protein